jgi:hypothetical protein
MQKLHGMEEETQSIDARQERVDAVNKFVFSTPALVSSAVILTCKCCPRVMDHQESYVFHERVAQEDAC